MAAARLTSGPTPPSFRFALLLSLATFQLLLLSRTCCCTRSALTAASGCASVDAGGDGTSTRAFQKQQTLLQRLSGRDLLVL